MKTTFTAFAQDHTDGQALAAVGAQLRNMHQSLAAQGRPLVIAIESSQKEVLTDPRDIAEMHNSGLMQAYFDDMYAKGETPSLDDFKKKHEKDLRWDATTLKKMTLDDIPAWAKDRDEALKARQDELLPAEFSFRQSVAKNDNFEGRGRSRLEKAAIYQFALENNVRIRGLDPLSDEEKSLRLGATEMRDMGSGIKLAVATGNIDKTALQEMEYERIQGMAQNACAIMSGLADGPGGCVVAMDMGAAHMASLEVAMNDLIQANPKLREAEVKMCVLVNEGEDVVQTKAQESMELSVKDMQKSHERRVNAVEHLRHRAGSSEKIFVGRKALASYLKGKDEGFLAEKVKDPAAFAKELAGLCPELRDGIGESDLLGEIEGANDALAEKEAATITDALHLHFQASDESVQKMEKKLARVRSEVQEADQKVRDHEKVAHFASRVKERIAQSPATLVPLAGKSANGYAAGVAKLGGLAGAAPVSAAAAEVSQSVAQRLPGEGLAVVDQSELLRLAQSHPRNSS